MKNKRKKIAHKLTPLASLLIPFFEALNNRCASYCVTGNYESLPEFTYHDVDIWTADVRAAESILHRVARQKGFKAHLVYRGVGGLCNIFHRIEEDGSISFIRIDLLTELSWRSVFSLIPPEIMGRNRILFKNFYVCDSSVEAASKLLYCLICKGKMRDKYKEMIFSRRNHPGFFEILEKAIGKKPAVWLLKQIGEENWRETEKKIGWLRFQVIKRNIFNLNIQRISVGLKALIIYIKKYLKPTGFFAVFLGPDGCGKSTLCKKVPEVLSAGFMEPKAKIFYWRPMLFPRIQKFLSIFGIGTKMEEDTNSRQSYSTPSGYFLSVIKFVYYWFDFMFGTLKFYSLWAKGGIVLFDRYYHDFFIYPERFRLRLPPRLIKIFGFLVPQPDLFFYVQAEPEVLILRKNEVPLGELKKQNDIYKQIIRCLPNGRTIDANQNIDKVVNKTSIAILDFMSERYYGDN